MRIECGFFNPPSPGKTLIVAAFSYRYDAHLVPDLLQNLRPFVQGWVACDDRDATDTLSNEVSRRRALLEAALGMGANWILVVDPDERFENRLIDCMSSMTEDHGPVIWAFHLREMFSVTQYRVDGLWAKKSRACLFPCQDGIFVPDIGLHGASFSYPSKVEVRDSGVAFYHLRMATAARRQARRDLYAFSDPDRQFQGIGYDYLADERNMLLETIPENRGFLPPYQEDNGLWAPDLRLMTKIASDPPHAKLRLFDRSVRDRDHVQGALILGDLAEQFPTDADFQLLALAASIKAHFSNGANSQTDAAFLKDLESNLDRVEKLQPKGALAPFLVSRMYDRLNAPDIALQYARRAIAFAPKSQILRQQVQRCLPMQERLSQPDALWRRWLTGTASHSEGQHMPQFSAKPQLAVVIIGFKAPAQLAEAVRSIRDQNTAAEIVVVNTGGGHPKLVLRDHLPYIRLIDVVQPLFIGAARNIGIDASDARFVAFLASDCLALPGWNSARLVRHTAGADAVASAVVPFDQDAKSSLAASAWLHRRRWPRAVDDPDSRHGFSYARHLFDEFGYFPTGPAITEDTMFNNRIAKKAVTVWAPEVQTAHRYPTDPISLARDMYNRAMRRLTHDYGSDLLKTSWVSKVLQLRQRLLNRHIQTRSMLPEMSELGLTRTLGGVERLILRQLIRSIRYAEFWGTVTGLGALARAERRLAFVQNSRSGPWRKYLAKLNCQRFPLIWRYHMAYAAQLGGADRARTTGKSLDAAVVAYGRAAALVPDVSLPTIAVCELLESHKKYQDSYLFAERAALSAPSQMLHLQRARSPAIKAGFSHEGLFAAQFVLISQPTLPQLHRYLADAYLASGQPDMAQRRQKTAEDLERSAK